MISTKISENPALITQMCVANKPQVQETILEVHTMVRAKKTVALFTTGNQESPFLVLVSKRKAAARLLEEHPDSLIGIYGPGQPKLKPGWVDEDIQAMGIVLK